MAQINLLPWREERRAERKEFLTGLALVAMAAVLLFIGDQLIKGEIGYQERTAFAWASPSSMPRWRKFGICSAGAELIERMQIIQDLQGNRPIIVRIMDQLVRTVPDGCSTSLVARSGRLK